MTRFKKRRSTGSILEINQVVLLIMFWRRRFEAQAKAQHVFFEHGVTRFTICEFLTQVIDDMLLLPISSCCPSTPPMDSSNTVRYMISGLPSTGGIKIGGSNRYSLILSNAFWQSSVHTTP